MNFNRIKKNYDNRLWTKQMVRTAVEKGVISLEEYFMITGDQYEKEINSN
ncbi:MAG: XkdX family protein [Lachnospiraceae bacterium]|nr:XkdX family protein [Lachnospiraceae bacterium]